LRKSPDRDRLVRWIPTCLLRYLGGIVNLTVTIVSLLFAFLWIYIAFITKERYTRAIIENLKSPDGRTCFDSIEMLQEIDREIAMKKFDELLLTDDEEVRNKVLRIMKSET